MVDTAQRRCAAIEGKDKKLTFVGAPVISGKKKGYLESNASSSSLGDSSILTGVIDQRLCILEELEKPADRDALIALHEKYMTEVSKAISAWPAYDASRYDELVLNLTKRRAAHKLEVEAGFEKKKHLIDENVLLTAIPYYDFLHLKLFDISYRAERGTEVYGKDIGDSAGKICLSKDDFSNAIRPALDQSRSIVVGLGIGKYSEAQALRLMLDQIYEAGAQRLVQAHLSNVSAAPVKCMLSDDSQPATPASTSQPVPTSTSPAGPTAPPATGPATTPATAPAPNPGTSVPPAAPSASTPQAATAASTNPAPAVTSGQPGK